MNRIFILFFAVAMMGFVACEQKPDTTASEESEQVLEPSEPEAAEDGGAEGEVEKLEESAENASEEIEDGVDNAMNEVEGEVEEAEQATEEQVTE